PHILQERDVCKSFACILGSRRNSRREGGSNGIRKNKAWNFIWSSTRRRWKENTHAPCFASLLWRADASIIYRAYFCGRTLREKMRRDNSHLVEIHQYIDQSYYIRSKDDGHSNCNPKCRSTIAKERCMHRLSLSVIRENLSMILLQNS